ncbi:MAG: carbamoyltransferase HypF [Eudoraea sp.]|nr:carbamoyltransferase HypF [Eudoraea sp.]
MQETYKISISGQVQGVGFRPHVFTLAQRFKLKGSVSNNEEGVVIYVTGPNEEVQLFYRTLIEKPPKISRIDKHSISHSNPKKFNDFQIIPSDKSGKLNLQLTPDFAICNECKTEILDSKNRRFSYPFTTCVNCGPRWAITKTFPFERAHTSISAFRMCETCEREYTDPSNRRFHSQTNSCASCGIKIELINADGKSIIDSSDTIFKKVSELLQTGNIVAIKNTGGYLLCCDATNSLVIQQLRNKKNRPRKPFAILYPTLELLNQQLHINAENEKLLTSPEAPIVIIQKTNYDGNLALAELAPGLNQLGVMLPYTGILQLLANELPVPIVATSGNVHGSPIISSYKIAEKELKGIADYFLNHNLEIINPQDDSVVKNSSKFDQKVYFRRSRGHAPNYFENYSGNDKIMAMGGHLKSTVAFLPNDYLYISQYLGNLDNYDVYERFTQTVLKFIELFEQGPSAILIDAHPSYQSSLFGKELANELDGNLYQIQHHKAHFASVLGEHDLFAKNESVLGVIWDGTGYGDDGQIWGGEFFSYNSNKIERVSHFDYFDWIAGDKMAREPRLSLFSLADEAMLEEVVKKFTLEEIGILKKLKEQNQLKTSSVGRLFDAVASLLDICQINSYEGEAAILLENAVTNYDLSKCRAYCRISDEGLVPTHSLLKELFNDFSMDIPKEEIILNFLFTLASLVFEIAVRVGLKSIAFSGGVFQNTILVDMLNEIGGKEYKLYFNCNLSPNDENISFGQIMHHLHIQDQ